MANTLPNTGANLIKDPVIRCNFSCNFGKHMFPSQFANIFLTYQTFVTNLHFLKVELH